MSSFEKLNDLDFLVWTNSFSDYQITNCSNNIPDSLKEIVHEEIGRKCSKLSSDDFVCMVGIIRILDHTEKFFIFRVFDAGEYRGRPNTLAIVGLIVPIFSQRRWNIAQALNSLQTPAPGKKNYELSSSSIVDQNIPNQPLWKSVENWDKQSGNEIPLDPVILCEPERLTPKIIIYQENEIEDNKFIFPVTLIVIILIALVSTPVAYNALLKTEPSKKTNIKHKEKKSPEKAKQNVQNTYLKKKKEKLIKDLYAIISNRYVLKDQNDIRKLNEIHFFNAYCSITKQILKEMRKLKKRLDSYEEDEIEEKKGLLRGYMKKGRKIVLQNAKTLEFNEENIKLLESYMEQNKKVHALIQSTYSMIEKANTDDLKMDFFKITSEIEQINTENLENLLK